MNASNFIRTNSADVFSVSMKISNFDKSAVVVTGWIIKTDEEFPCLTSCYVKKK